MHPASRYSELRNLGVMLQLALHSRKGEQTKSNHAPQELVRVLGSPTASRRVRFDCVMLLSDLLESAITTDARCVGL